ncbi:NAD(P)-binding protein [Kribbella sandramycini]|uniref:NAD(P)-binding protein n=1 Tax=Kribbella sandramycini TaxID=60450 RepID=A0A7Y4NYW3_9ACTN|nr:NAD(P)/FAD-dependent oxidoreductase [Kribbella sandramycini]MBB6569188.1 putative NAD/FAD-dependent oxidoreductase [Kribbella sandramycini]NOL40971.1 NAD(P)-binding protein [Kribbella sandramycini]
MDDAEVVVIGAGLAGLAAARTLHQAGRRVLVLEKDDAVGGRVRTDEMDGFLLDRGFQVLLPDYPEFRRVLAAADLDLRYFTRGVLVDGPDHRWELELSPRGFAGAAQFGFRRPRDAAAVAGFSARDAAGGPHRLRELPPASIGADLRGRGISAATIDEIFRPFLAGVFLDPNLTTSARLFHLIWRCFLRGGAAVPAQGMQKLPQALAGALPEGTVRLSTAVREVGPGWVRTESSPEPIHARAVILATDATDAAALAPGVEVPRWNGVTTWYFAAPQAPLPQPTLLLDGKSGLLINSVVMSEVAPTYAPPGQALISASTPKDAVDEQTIRARLAELYRTSTTQWQLVQRYEIPRALPAMPAAHPLTTAPALTDSLYLCGDYRDTSSIQGALVSGRRVAAALLQNFSR